MKITKHKQNTGFVNVGDISIRLTHGETLYLKCILQRYNQGKGTMANPTSNGFPLKLQQAIEKVVTK